MEHWKRLYDDPLVQKIAAVFIALFVLYLLARVASLYVMRNVADTATRYRLRKGVVFTGYLLAVLILISSFSERVAGLGVAFGVAGAGIAFALQEVIASAAGWVAISLSRFYAPGDRVQVGGIKGDVIDIGILRTTLMETGGWINGDLYNGRIVRVANSSIFKDPVYNYSADFAFLWDEITLPIRYGSDWEYARSMITAIVHEVCHDYAVQSKSAWKETVKRYQLEDAQIEPMITLTANDNWIEFTVRYIVDYRRRRFTKDRLFTRLLEEVDRSSDRIRLASATFEVTNLPRLDVSFREGHGQVVSRHAP